MALHAAACGGSLEVVNVLIAAGVDANAKDKVRGARQYCGMFAKDIVCYEGRTHST